MIRGGVVSLSELQQDAEIRDMIFAPFMGSGKIIVMVDEAEEKRLSPIEQLQMQAMELLVPEKGKVINVNKK